MAHLDETKDLLVAAARLRYAPETAQKCVLLHHRLQGVEPKSAVAAASLFLAGKADEQPRRVRDVLNAVAPAGGVRDLDEMYHDAKADLVDAEQAALRELCFDASMETPLALALALAHALTLRPANCWRIIPKPRRGHAVKRPHWLARRKGSSAVDQAKTFSMRST